MKVDVKKVDSTRRELKIQVPKERVSAALEDIYKEIGKEAKVKGFRPGKAPRHVIESHYREIAREEMIKKVIPEAYQEGIAKENLSPIDLPEIHDVSFKDGMVSFTAKLDIKPDVKVGNYKGIKVKRKDSKVTEEEMAKVFDVLKKGQGKEKDKELKIDDEFAKGLGYPSLKEFKDVLKRQMEMDKDRQNRLDIENQVVDALIKSAKLTVPQAIVDKQLDMRIRDMKQRFNQQKVPQEEIEKKEKEMRKNLRSAAEKDIKLYFILDKIAQLENISVGPQENMVNKVMEFLLKEASWEEGKSSGK